MATNGKYHPVLYSGFQISDGIRIRKFLWKSDGLEDYELSNGKYLVLSENRVEKSKPLILQDKVFHYSVSDKPRVASVDVGEVNQAESSVANGDSGVAILPAAGFVGVAGMHDLKKTLMNDVIKPIRDSSKYARFKIKPPNGILLFGPPGCGKTFIARKLGEELGMSFIETKHSDFASIYVHGATEKISSVFKRARQNKPCILFIDEIDGALPKRTELSGSADHKHEEVNEFLMQMNKLSEHQVILIAASNRPEQIDEAVLRTGRIDKIIYVPPPDKEALVELFRLYLMDRPIATDISYEDLADKTIGFSCSDIEYICDEAARDAVESNLESITAATIINVIEQTKPSISDTMKRQYSDFAKIENRLFDEGGKKSIGFLA